MQAVVRPDDLGHATRGRRPSPARRVACRRRRSVPRPRRARAGRAAHGEHGAGEARCPPRRGGRRRQPRDERCRSPATAGASGDADALGHPRCVMAAAQARASREEQRGASHGCAIRDHHAVAHRVVRREADRQVPGDRHLTEQRPGHAPARRRARRSRRAGRLHVGRLLEQVGAPERDQHGWLHRIGHRDQARERIRQRDRSPSGDRPHVGHEDRARLSRDRAARRVVRRAAGHGPQPEVVHGVAALAERLHDPLADGAVPFVGVGDQAIRDRACADRVQRPPASRTSVSARAARSSAASRNRLVPTVGMIESSGTVRRANRPSCRLISSTRRTDASSRADRHASRRRPRRRSPRSRSRDRRASAADPSPRGTPGPLLHRPRTGDDRPHRQRVRDHEAVEPAASRAACPSAPRPRGSRASSTR